MLDADDTVPKLAVDGPEICTQLPVPNTGLFAASVVVVTLHKAWSTPALANEEEPYTSTSVESVILHPAGEIVVIR